jgi:hypothetical protein
LQIEKEFEMQRKDPKIVKELIDYCFIKLDDNLNEKIVLQELIKNPSKDH